MAAGRHVRAGTISEAAIRMAADGKKPAEIAKVLNRSPNSIRVLLWKRRHQTRRMFAGVDR